MKELISEFGLRVLVGGTDTANYFCIEKLIGTSIQQMVLDDETTKRIYDKLKEHYEAPVDES